MPFYIKLFNLIVQSALYTQSTNRVTRAIQQGIETYVYLVTLENCSLYLYLEENKILHNSQVCFLPENSIAGFHSKDSNR